MKVSFALGEAPTHCGRVRVKAGSFELDFELPMAFLAGAKRAATATEERAEALRGPIVPIDDGAT